MPTRFGATVKYCGHEGVFIADLFDVADATVVRATGPVTGDNLVRSRQRVASATHHLLDFPEAGFWRPDLGVFVVPAKQVLVITKAPDAHTCPAGGDHCQCFTRSEPK